MILILKNINDIIMLIRSIGIFFKFLKIVKTVVDVNLEVTVSCLNCWLSLKQYKTKLLGQVFLFENF